MNACEVRGGYEKQGGGGGGGGGVLSVLGPIRKVGSDPPPPPPQAYAGSGAGECISL